MKLVKIGYERDGRQKDIYEELEVINVFCPFCGKYICS